MAQKRNPTYTVVKPTAAELRAIKPYLVDKVVRWAQSNDDVCELVEEALTLAFGRKPAAGWRDSDGRNFQGFDINGLDCDGFNIDGYDKDNRDSGGFHRVTRLGPDGYDRYGYDKDGWNKDGYNNHGQHRDGVDHLLSKMTPKQKVEMKQRLASLISDSDDLF